MNSEQKKVSVVNMVGKSSEWLSPGAMLYGTMREKIRITIITKQ